MPMRMRALEKKMEGRKQLQCDDGYDAGVIYVYVYVCVHITSGTMHIRQHEYEMRIG